MKNFLALALCCVFLRGALAAAPSDVTVAVLEAEVAGTNITKNIENYKAQLKADNRFGPVPNIVVLPEYGLTGIETDNVEKYAIEIKDSIATKTNLSLIDDWAKEIKGYVVANFLEKDGDDYYSTTVVVNGTAKLLAKYRKINLNETESKLKAGNDLVTFDTDYGKIGLIAGDDILYENPSEKIFENNTISAIIYTTAFTNTAPFKIAPSLQQGYAQAKSINLFVANVHNPGKGMGGSGIYSKVSVYAYVQAAQGSKFTIVKVPVKQVKNVKNFNVVSSMGAGGGVDPDIKSLISNYVYDTLNTQVFSKNLNQSNTCADDFCCNFTVSATFDKSETYRMAVKGGDQKICAILFCTDKEKLESCGVPRKDAMNTVFTAVEIKTEKNDQKFRPYFSSNDLKPERFDFGQNDTGIVIKSNDKRNNVLVMGIITASGASSVSIMLGVYLIAFFVILKNCF